MGDVAMPENKAPLFGNIRELVDSLQSEGRYTFDRNDALAALETNAVALKKAIARLASKKRVVVPRRGFYVIVPIEYRAFGAPPPSWFIDDLMHLIGRPYYVGVLSASALHGAAHQQPQEFQVISDRPQRPMQVGRGKIRFMVKRHITRSYVDELKTETGTMLISTPETTALDLLRYVYAAAGLGNVVTVLAELAERIDPLKLTEAAKAERELAYAQRLGYLLDLVGAEQQSSALAQYVAENQPRPISLAPGRPQRGHHTDRRWQVIENEEIGADL
jgi:predicted transcriptional regulator of viral defense system